MSFPLVVVVVVAGAASPPPPPAPPPLPAAATRSSPRLCTSSHARSTALRNTSAGFRWYSRYRARRCSHTSSTLRAS
eukprot:30145-Pelagococcus_subviridis.AAC.1